MKFTLATKEFNYLVSKCFNVVSQKPAIPILANILIEASNGMVRMSATDLTVGISSFMPAEIAEEGITALPAKKLSQLARELTSTHVELSTSPNEITELLADSSRFRIHGMPGALYPALPDLEGTVSFTLPQKELKDALSKTAFAVSREDNRYVLSGVFMQVENGRATFFGTDGKRLARSSMEINLDKSFSGNFVIPLKAIEEIIKNLMEEGEATLYLMSDKAAVRTHDALLVSKLLVGEYPDVKRIIPSQVETNVALHREELMALLRQVSLFTRENYQVVRLTFDQGELKISANDATLGDGNVSMPANYQKGRLEIAFNPNFFLDILRHSEGEVVTLSLIDSFNPGIITANKTQPAAEPFLQDASPLFVLMPMRLNEE